MRTGAWPLCVCVFQACITASVVEVSPKPGDAFDVSVKGRLATSCGLTPSRYYDADSEPIEKLAACLTTGAFGSEHVTISGTMDTRPRRLAVDLERRGVAPERITVIERGTLSSGMSESDLDKENDRRVQLELTGGRAAPEEE